MRVSQEGDVFRGTHITGPTHNYLMLKVSQGPVQGDFDVLVRPGEACCYDTPLTAAEVRGWIATGLARPNDELDAKYVIEVAEVVENDSRLPHVYEELARRIVIAAHQAGTAKA